MEHDLLERLIDFIENASPVIWGAAVRQVAVQSATHLIWGALLLLVTLALAFAAKSFWKAHQRDRYKDHNENAVILGVIAMIIGFIGLLLCTHGISLLINPEYYAIYNLLDLIQ